MSRHEAFETKRPIAPSGSFAFQFPENVPISRILTWEQMMNPAPPRNRAELVLRKIQHWREGAGR